MAAIGSSSSRPTPRSLARSTAIAPIATSHAAMPFDLKTTTSSGEFLPSTVPRDDLRELVHLEPVEHALRHRFDQVAGLDPRVVDGVAADERCPLHDAVVELTGLRPVGTGSAHERARLQPFSA